jgi:hypothetical protein
MHSHHRKGDFLTWFLLTVALGLGLTVALQARARQAEPEPLPDAGQTRTGSLVLGSSTLQASRVEPWRNRSPSAS